MRTLQYLTSNIGKTSLACQHPVGEAGPLQPGLSRSGRRLSPEVLKPKPMLFMELRLHPTRPASAWNVTVTLVLSRQMRVTLATLRCPFEMLFPPLS